MPSFRFRTLFVLALAALPPWQGIGAADTGGKPGAPLSLAIAPRGEIERGAVGEFTVTATALADSNDFSLVVDLPDGLALYSGDLQRRGAVQRGTRFVLTFALRIPEGGNHLLTATARMRKGETGLFEARAEYAIGERPRRAPVADSGNTSRRDGDAVREYRLP